MINLAYDDYNNLEGVVSEWLELYLDMHNNKR